MLKRVGSVMKGGGGGVKGGVSVLVGVQMS